MSAEPSLRFGCFGGEVSLHLGPRDEADDVGPVLQRERERLLAVHDALSRFLDHSELSELNRSQSPTLPASPLMRMFVRAAVFAARRSGGLVDPTLVGQIERAGYRESLQGTETLPLRDALAIAGPARHPAAPDPKSSWRAVGFDDRAGTVSRPPGTRLDSGGVAKGLAADLIASGLRAYPTFAVDCGGDIRIGGAGGAARTVRVDDPFGGHPLHEFEVQEGAVATSGIGKRAWIGPDGAPAHHLLDPASGKPAFTGIVQVSALAPTAQLAEVLAKTALLGGPDRAAAELSYGGCVVLDDGSFEIVDGSRPTAVLPRPDEPRAVSA